MRTQKESDQEPYDVTAIRILIRLMILREKNMRTLKKKESDQEPYDVTDIRLLIRIMILRENT